jgi:hypothetical protein
MLSQPVILIGLIAYIAASPLQDDIAFTSRKLLQIGQDILAAANRPNFKTQGVST